LDAIESTRRNELTAPTFWKSVWQTLTGYMPYQWRAVSQKCDASVSGWLGVTVVVRYG
jgi:hypothetical protein